MSVKSFKFVSPGVFINEIDNSFVPRSSDEIGPVVVGRATRGLGLQPIKVQSYSKFVELFGDTVPGGQGGDISRYGNFSAPMYGTYGAKAFLAANVAPLTYIRLLGAEHPQATTAGKAGWNTDKSPAATLEENGGAYGLFVWPSQSLGTQATTTFTVTDKNGFRTGNTCILTDSNGDAVTLTVNQSAASSNGVIGANSDATASIATAAASFAAAINATADATALDISASNPTSATILLTQLITGTAGNTSIGGTGMSTVTSASFTGGAGPVLGTGSLAAIWYAENSSSILLSGAYAGEKNRSVAAPGVLISTDSNNLFTVLVTSSNGTYDQTVKFGFDDNSDSFIRTKFNANPTLASAVGTYYDTAAYKPYWLGESFEQEMRDLNIPGNPALGTILPLALSGTLSTSPSQKRVASQEARTPWFIGQDLEGQRSGFRASTDTQKLFRLIGRGHGEWLQRNCKVSIEKIRQSTSTTSDYGTFSIVIRQLQDSDNRVVVLERFDNLTLDPGSPNYIARAIGDVYHEWDNQSRQLKARGSYPNQSKYVYVDMNTTVAAGASMARNLPFGYFGPPRYTTTTYISGNVPAAGSTMIGWATGQTHGIGAAGKMLLFASGENTCVDSASFAFPSVRLRVSGADGGLSDQKNAYYGMQTTRTATSTRYDESVADVHCMLDARYLQSVDPTTTSISGADAFSYVFTLNDIRTETSGDNKLYYYESGSYQQGTSYTKDSYETLLNDRVNRFTAPFYGGYDGVDIKKPDPFANSLLSGKTELNSSAYYTIKRAIDTVADPEAVDMNLISMPGLTDASLTTHMLNVSEDRADTMALIDLPSVYTPPHEAYNATFAARLGAGAETTANTLKNRRLDTSYGAAFYPWVQTLDEATQRLVWIPPSVAMMGVLASSQASAHLWFAPAGFNRGGLSDGAAGIPITNVTERLTSKDRDVLYEAKINPIASFPSTGLVVFGQKTLQERQSALDRINVRRLVIYLKKQISILSTQVLFEQNVPTTWNRFKSLVEPFLANVKVQFGITDYRLILDESTTTPDLVDQNIMYAKIMIKPARAIEYIAIDFVVASTGASFDD